MSDKKHIDRLFQEKLKNFEASPSDAVWNNINAQLKQNEKGRRVIPMWMRIAGVAAALILLFTIGNSILNDNKETNPETIVDTEAPSNTDSNLDNDESITDTQEDQTQIASEDKLNEEGDDLNASEASDNRLNDQNEELISNRSDSRSNVTSQNNDDDSFQLQQENKDPIKSENNLLLNEGEGENAIVDNKSSDLPQNNSDQEQLDEKNSDLIENTIKSGDAVVESGTKVDEQSDLSNQTEATENENSDKQSIQDAIAEAEELKDDDEKEKRGWSVSPHIAPVYFNTFGAGSAIDPQFNNNPTSGDVNLSYGVVANYHVNDKLSIRGGINKMDLGYSIGNVVVYNNIDDTVDDIHPLKNVRLNEYGQSLSFLSTEGLNFAEVPGAVAQNIESSIGQEFSYIEVPMEVQYKLNDSKLNVSLIGGVSTLFLTDNSVYTTLQGEQRQLGEATNIKNTSFSANFGVGLNYNVSDHIDLNLEPMFKYQMNTFNDTNGNFNPYIIGIYTGFRFKF